MQSKNQITIKNLRILICSIFFVGFLFLTGCKKEKHEVLNSAESVNVRQPDSYSIPTTVTGKILNPYSLKNIRQAQTQYGTDRVHNISPSDVNLMIRIDVGSIDENSMPFLEDSNIAVHSVPLDAPELYQPGATEATYEGLRNTNYLYTTVPVGHGLLSHVTYSVLDSLYHPTEAEDTMNMCLLLKAGYYFLDASDSAIDVNSLKIKIKLPSRHYPEGDVTYTDEQLGTRGSIGVTAWAIDFGFTVTATANASGHYRIDRGFYVGTTLGLHYKNWRVNVKPINTTSSIPANIARITSNFVEGSRYVDGWVSHADMQSKNINITAHSQLRFWAHIMNSVFNHDGYCNSESIAKSPNYLVIYAHWKSGTGFAATPMLGHMSVTKAVFDPIISKALGISGALATYPNFFNIMYGLLPDITMPTPGSIPGGFGQYSCVTTQTLFHELSHASYFLRVGIPFWVNVANQELVNECSSSGTVYGCGSWSNTASPQQDNYIQMTEAWAEFLGQNFASRLYSTGEITSRQLGTQQLTLLRENETFFEDGWICKGIFNDLIDGGSGPTNTEGWDTISGRTISQLYNLFGPSVVNVQDYKSAYVTAYGSTTAFQTIAVNNGVTP